MPRSSTRCARCDRLLSTQEVCAYRNRCEECYVGGPIVDPPTEPPPHRNSRNRGPYYNTKLHRGFRVIRKSPDN